VANKPDFVADIADWPKGPKGRGSSSMGSGYPVSSQSKHAEDAWLWLSEYLGKDENRSVLSQFVKTGKGTPVRYSLLAKWEKSQFAPPSARLIAPALKEYAVVGRPITPVQADPNKVVNDAFNAVWAGQSSMAQAARQIKQLAPPILELNKRK
jgi:ABC-type glycerol-3-phosphate transport system substrate-binding protein